MRYNEDLYHHVLINITELNKNHNANSKTSMC